MNATFVQEISQLLKVYFCILLNMGFVMIVSIYFKIDFLIPFNTCIIITENHDSDKISETEYDDDNMIQNLDGQVDLPITSYEEMIDAFFTKAKNVKCPDGTPKECMAYLVGYKEEGLLIPTELIYPEQEGDSGMVEDIAG